MLSHTYTGHLTQRHLTQGTHARIHRVPDTAPYPLLPPSTRTYNPPLSPVPQQTPNHAHIYERVHAHACMPYLMLHPSPLPPPPWPVPSPTPPALRPPGARACCAAGAASAAMARHGARGCPPRSPPATANTRMSATANTRMPACNSKHEDVCNSKHEDVCNSKHEDVPQGARLQQQKGQTAMGTHVAPPDRQPATAADNHERTTCLPFGPPETARGMPGRKEWNASSYSPAQHQPVHPGFIQSQPSQGAQLPGRKKGGASRHSPALHQPVHPGSIQSQPSQGAQLPGRKKGGASRHSPALHQPVHPGFIQSQPSQGAQLPGRKKVGVSRHSPAQHQPVHPVKSAQSGRTVARAEKGGCVQAQPSPASASASSQVSPVRAHSRQGGKRGVHPGTAQPTKANMSWCKDGCRRALRKEPACSHGAHLELHFFGAGLARVASSAQLWGQRGLCNLECRCNCGYATVGA